MNEKYLCEFCQHKDVCKYVKEHMLLEGKLRKVVHENYVPFVVGAYANCEKFIHD